MPHVTLTARAHRALFGVAIALTIAVQSALAPAATFGADAAAQLPSPVPVGDTHPSLEAQLAGALRRARENSNSPGLSVAAISPSGKTWSGANGTFQSGASLNPTDALTIGSVTKTFVAAVVLALVDEGRIQLDVPASTYLPRAMALENGATVRQLLSHTSGIADLYGPAKDVLSGDPWRVMGSNDVLEPIGGDYFAPGTGYAYSNTNYYLLGHIVEVVTHHSFNDELAARFTGPLGLASVRLLTAADTVMPAAWTTTFWTSGAMVSTPMDLARWGRALYGGQVLSEASTGRMLDFSAGHHYGLGAQLLPLGGQEVPGHSGLMYEMTTLLVRLPDGMTLAIVSTQPYTDLEAVLVGNYGGPSLLELLYHLDG